jgi:hypothetical protein
LAFLIETDPFFKFICTLVDILNLSKNAASLDDILNFEDNRSINPVIDISHLLLIPSLLFIYIFLYIYLILGCPIIIANLEHNVLLFFSQQLFHDPFKSSSVIFIFYLHFYLKITSFLKTNVLYETHQLIVVFLSLPHMLQYKINKFWFFLNILHLEEIDLVVSHKFFLYPKICLEFSLLRIQQLGRWRKFANNFLYDFLNDLLNCLNVLTIFLQVNTRVIEIIG